MQRIKIYEKDATTNVINTVLGYGSVFIPGFLGIGGQAGVNEPHECQSVAEFTKYFGNAPATFTTTQYYPYNGVPYARGTATSEANMVQKYGLYKEGATSYATEFDNTKSYSKDELAIRNLKLYFCKDGYVVPQGETHEWKADEWEEKLASGDYIEVSTANKTTYYSYQIQSVTISGQPCVVGKVTEYVPATNGFPKGAIPHEVDDDLTKIAMFIANDTDPSWNIAYSLLSLGMPVTYVVASNTVSVAEMYSYLNGVCFDLTSSLLLDKSLNIQFLTSGGYPTLEWGSANSSNLISEKMIALAKDRGDSIALLDHTDNPNRDLTGANSVFESIGLDATSYAAVYTPWCDTTLKSLTKAPASVVYLYTLATNLVASPSWTIIAGITNGRCSIVKNLRTRATLTNKIAEYYQNDFAESTHKSINAITYIRNYGYCIWGNRTFELYKPGNTGFSLSFVNIRNMVSEIKKTTYFTAQQLMFEINNDVLWTKFKSKISATLEKMVDGFGLEAYQIQKVEVTDKTKLKAIIIIYPAYGVESVEVTVSLEDNNTVEVTSETT